MCTDDFSREDEAETMRKKFLYRRLILSGKLVLPYKRAAQLLGPDCLYHLYSIQESISSRPRESASRSQAARVRKR
jgi:hypothetical protein